MPLPSRFRPNKGIVLLSFLSLGILGFGWLYLSQAVTSLVTVDAQSGKVLWSTPFDDVAPIRRIITRKGQVYILAASRKGICGNWCIFPPPDVPGITEVTAFDAVSGKQLWRVRTRSNNLDWADIQVTENSVLLKTDQLTALDPTSGRTQWSVPLPPNSPSPYEGAPSFNPNLVVSGDRVALLRVSEMPDQRTSRALVETWQKTTGKQHQAFTPTSPSVVGLDEASLAATDDTILLFLPGQTPKIFGYAPETGKLKFSITTLVRQGYSIQDFYRNLLFSGSTIYQYIYNGPNQGKPVISVEAYDANTGKLRWQMPISDSRCVDFGAVPGGFYFSCYSPFSFSTAYLKFLDENTGQQQWMKRFPEEKWLSLTSNYNSYPSLTRFHGYNVTLDAIVASVQTRVDAERQSTRLVVFAKTDGREVWSGDLDKISLYGADGDRVFLRTEVPRLSNLGIRF